MEAWGSVGRIADVLTIVAAGIALFGALASLLTRPRVKVTASAWGPAAAHVHVLNEKGSTPARNFYLGRGVLNEHGVAMSGEGASPWAPTLLTDHALSIEVYDSRKVTFSDPPPKNVLRMEVNEPSGIVLDISWQRPLLPWLRARRVVLWTQDDRASGRAPKVLRGRTAARMYRNATTPVE